MKKPGILCLFIIIVQFGFGQSKDEIAVADAVEKLKAAMLSGEKSALEAVTADELTYGHSMGKLEDKAAFVEALSSGADNYEKIEISDQTIKVAANVAWVRHTFTAEIVSKGNSVTVKLLVLLVWVKQKGQWKLFARQGFKV